MKEDIVTAKRGACHQRATATSQRRVGNHVIVDNVDGAARNLLRNRNNLMSCYGSMITMFTEKATVLLGPFDAARCHSLALASQQWFTEAGE